MIQGSETDAAESGTPARWDPRDTPHLAQLTAVRPEVDTWLGGQAGLNAFGDAGPTGRASVLEALVAWRAALEPQANDSRERMLDVRVFAASLELTRFAESEIALHTRDPDVFTPLFTTLLYHLRGHVRHEAHRFESLARRLKALGPALLSARRCVDRPSEELLARAQDVLDGGGDLLRAIDDAGQRAHRSGAIAVGLAAELHDATAAAGAALDEHRGWLTGLSASPYVPLGMNRFDELLRLRGLDLRSGDVLDLARSVTEELRIEELRIARRAYKDMAPDRVVPHARRAAPNSLGEAVSWAHELVREARAFMHTNGSVALPDGDSERVVVDVMPSVLAASGTSAIALPPQPYAPVAETLLLLREPPGAVADALPELSVADLENISAACAYPGAHLRHAWAARTTSAARGGVPLAGLSPVACTWGADMSLGWAHSAEEMMRELLFRNSPASRVVMLRRAMEAALAAAVDVCLQIGRLSPEAAAAFLVRRAGLRLPVARAQVRAMLRAPGLGLSPFVGKVRIQQLRREAHKRWRDGYGEKRFTSLLMNAGPVPLAYLFERLDDKPVFSNDEPTGSFNVA